MSDPIKLTEDNLRKLALKDYTVSYQADAASETIKVVKTPIEYGSNGAYRPGERGARCPFCLDRGLIPIKQESTRQCKCCPDGHVYDTNVRCTCPAGERFGPRETKDGPWEVTSYLQVFGRHPHKRMTGGKAGA